MPVEVVTAAAGNYETTLMAEMGKSDAPTLFQVNGPVGLASWKDYCYDLSGSDIYGQLTSDSYALKEGDTVYGIGYVIESYGLIVNKTLLDVYKRQGVGRQRVAVGQRHVGQGGHAKIDARVPDAGDQPRPADDCGCFAFIEQGGHGVIVAVRLQRRELFVVFHPFDGLGIRCV